MIVDPDFFDHWKTQLLTEELGGDPSAPLCVLRLWAHCQNRKRSSFESLSPKALRAMCRYQGDAEQLAAALVESGFVEISDDWTVTVVGWDEYNAKLISNWGNGKKGGRPKTQPKPKRNPPVTQAEPTNNPLETQLEPNANPTRVDANPTETDKIRVDKSRVDKSTTPLPPKGENSGKASKPFDAAEVDLPSSLDTQPFREAWAAWCNARKSRGKRISEVAARAQIKKLAAHGPERSIAAIHNSIANDYQGLFPESQAAPAKQDQFAGLLEFAAAGGGDDD